MKKNDSIKIPEGQVSLVETEISDQQVLHIMQKTPVKHIYTRPAKGGGQWDYVTGVYVKKSLNYAFGWMWDFEVKDHGKEADLIWVLGRLTVNLKDGRKIVKEQFGRADAKMKRDKTGYLDYGNDLKAATTDALKKCASELGIASDIYGKNEFKDIKYNVVKNASDYNVNEVDLGRDEIDKIMEIKTINKLLKHCGDLKKAKGASYQKVILRHYNERKAQLENTQS